MKRLVRIAVLCVATLAVAQPKGNSARVGAPLSPPQPSTVTMSANADQPPGRTSTPDAGVLDVQLPKLQYDAGETVVLTTHLHTKGGADIDGADVAVDDATSSGPMDIGQKQGARRHGLAKGKGQQNVTLDNSPGEHNLTVWADGIDPHGNSVHLAVSTYYVVGTGELRFLDVGRVHPVADLLVVELKVQVKTAGVFDIEATLATNTVAVAQASTEVTLQPGPATIELPFAQRDIVEPGPYHLVNVHAMGGGSPDGPMMVAAPRAVGTPFQAKNTGVEPEPQRNEDGEVVGTGRGAYDPNAPPPPDPEPQPAVIPPLPPEYGYPVDLNAGGDAPPPARPLPGGPNGQN